MGAQVSTSTNTLYNKLSSSITQSMSQKVDANVTVNCQNINEVIGAKNCSITFGPQVCKAAGVADVTTNGQFAAEATQDVSNSIEQLAKSSVSGITVGANISHSSNFAKNVVEVATTTVQSFNTDCSKNASAINRNMITDCQDSTISTAAQSSDVSVMGSCAATAAASSSSFNKVANVVSQSATSEVKGIDLMSMGIIFLFVLLFLFVGPPLMKAVTSTWSQSAQTDEEKKKKEASSQLVITLAMIIVGYAGLVWPGIAAGFAHVYPWPPAVVNYKEDFCTDGKAGSAEGKQYNIDPRAFINDFVFFDEKCTLTPPGETCEQARHYKTCGLFSGLCNDPNAIADLAAYRASAEACAALSGLYQELSS